MDFKQRTLNQLADLICGNFESDKTEYIAGHNLKPKPFIWTAQANDILAKATRARTALNKIISI